MKLGVVIDGTDHFISDLLNDWKLRYQLEIFSFKEHHYPFYEGRINRFRKLLSMRRFLKRNDVIFFEWASELLTIATHLTKASKIVTRLHRYEMYEWVNLVNWEKIDKIILVSNAKKREFISKFPQQEHKIIVSNVSICLDKFQPIIKAFTGNIGILCHLIPRKRVYDLILTFYELSKKKNGLTLHIGGGINPSQEEYYEALLYIVRALNLEDKVIFYSNVTDTPNWFQRIDIFISNSYSEGLQVAPMEAMASGCYCLSHHWDGADELLPLDNLFFTNSELIEKIIDYCNLSETEKQEKQSEMRAIACEKFDLQQTIIKMRHVFNELAETHIS